MTITVATTVQLRPQPVGVFPFPAGLLLLPPCRPSAPEALAGLMRGEAQTALPVEWRFFGLALQRDYAAALEAVEGDDAVARHNRLTLGQSISINDDGELATLTSAVRYAMGQIENPPSADGLDAELRAFVLMLQAARSIESEEFSVASETLKQAIAASRTASPEFAAQLLGQLASLETGSPALATMHYREGIALATGRTKAELSLQLGVMLQDIGQGNKAMLLEAVKAYQEALRFGISLEETPESFALLQNNLALAYLGMPMNEAGDQLRMGIAVQSLREALKVYTKNEYPEQWASAQMNLANALQHIPTSHPEENLIQAVEIYEEILSVRQKAFDPVGYARLLANQANALAHLGIFGPAMEKIGEAYKLFQWHDEPELAKAAMNLVQNISEQRANGPA